MTTIATTTGHSRTPLIAALAVGSALVVGGAIGVAWDQDDSTPTSTHAPAYTHSYTRYFYWVAPSTADQVSGATSGSPGGATTADEFSGTFSGTTHPYPVPRTTSGSPHGYTTSVECRGCRHGE